MAWLEHHLQRYPGTVIAVTHDRYFLDNVAGWILELDRGEGCRGRETTPRGWSRRKSGCGGRKSRRASAERPCSGSWNGSACRPRTTRQGRARITSYEELLGQEGEKKAKDLEIFIPPGPRLGKVVVEAEGVSKGYRERLLVEDMSFTLPPGGIVGVIGPNGAGKTTLFRMITGQETPDSGVIRVGDTVKLAYVDQSRDALDPEKSIWEVTPTARTPSNWAGSRSIPGRTRPASTSRARISRKKSACCPVESETVHLARMLKEGANVLLLDEPPTTWT